ncbi:hypothetical protein J27TS7_16380 [Paenibacillus dendritiformis]|uniref:hypothetical protein n=1 Tax=Paenibacillus dendritiformis TaxID=130049 RepID=UPI001B0BE55A|nr:hypothetical protein [Paenibacillus dendritiformis]GIO72124.1 hypothetical protein J27TS7_16380 [Paenibacillus dendritiformis]
MIKVKMDNANKLVYVWMTEQDKDSAEFLELKEDLKTRKFKSYKLITFVSGTDDVLVGLEKVVLQNALKNNVEPVFDTKVQ